MRWELHPERLVHDRQVAVHELEDKVLQDDTVLVGAVKPNKLSLGFWDGLGRDLLVILPGSCLVGHDPVQRVDDRDYDSVEDAKEGQFEVLTVFVVFLGFDFHENE